MKPNHIYNTRGKKPMVVKKSKRGMPAPMLAISHTKVFPKNLEEFNWEDYFMMPKLDGIRAITYDGKLWSRTGKQIRNVHVQEKFKDLPEGLDGELYVHGLPFHELSSMIMGEHNTKGATVEYHVFDRMDAEADAQWRWDSLQDLIRPGSVRIVPHYNIESYEEFYDQDSLWIQQGYEGSMLKHKASTYKHGRAGKTKKELIKIKQVETAEFKVTGVEPLEHNTNEATEDEYGRTKRSSAKAGKVVDPTRMGKLIGTCITKHSDLYGAEITTGSGFTDAMRKELMESWNSGTLKGRIVEFKHYPGGKDAARQPIFLRFRTDME